MPRRLRRVIFVELHDNLGRRFHDGRARQGLLASDHFSHSPIVQVELFHRGGLDDADDCHAPVARHGVRIRSSDAPSRYPQCDPAGARILDLQTRTEGGGRFGIIKGGAGVGDDLFVYGLASAGRWTLSVDDDEAGG